MRRTQHNGSGARSFTLIELLAVIVILSLAAGLALGGLSAQSEFARVEQAARRWSDLDGKARLLARRGRAVSIGVRDGSRFVLHVDGDSENLIDETLPPPLRAALDTNAEIATVAVDPSGCTADYIFEIEATSGTRRWRVAGLTGWIEELRAGSGS